MHYFAIDAFLSSSCTRCAMFAFAQMQCNTIQSTISSIPSNKLSTTIIAFIHNSMWEHWKRKLQPNTNRGSRMHTTSPKYRRCRRKKKTIHTHTQSRSNNSFNAQEKRKKSRATTTVAAAAHDLPMYMGEFVVCMHIAQWSYVNVVMHSLYVLVIITINCFRFAIWLRAADIVYGCFL